jgi:hypothetical protein
MTLFNILKDIICQLISLLYYSIFQLLQGKTDIDNNSLKRKEIRQQLKEIPSSNENYKISVIIPTYNEENNIEKTINSALKDDKVEIIVSDGGSTDGTLNICKKFNVKVISGGSTRAQCQNIGSSAATGDILLFLHADTILPHCYGTHIRKTIASNTNIIILSINPN